MDNFMCKYWHEIDQNSWTCMSNGWNQKGTPVARNGGYNTMNGLRFKESCTRADENGVPRWCPNYAEGGNTKKEEIAGSRTQCGQQLETEERLSDRIRRRRAERALARNSNRQADGGGTAGVRSQTAANNGNNNGSDDFNLGASIVKNVAKAGAKTALPGVVGDVASDVLDDLFS